MTVFLCGAGKKVERVKLKDFVCPNADGTEWKSPISIMDRRTDTIFFCFMSDSFLNLIGVQYAKILRVCQAKSDSS
jgi:hypothetical protein